MTEETVYNLLHILCCVLLGIALRECLDKRSRK